MAEVIIGITIKRAQSDPGAESRSGEMREKLYRMGWTDVMGPRGPEKGLYINNSSLNTISQIISYLKMLSDDEGNPLLHPGDKVSIRVIGPQGGKAHYVVQNK